MHHFLLRQHAAHFIPLIWCYDVFIRVLKVSDKFKYAHSTPTTETRSPRPAQQWTLLTALGCIRGRSCAGHTGYSEKHGRPNQQGSHEETGNPPQVWWWIQIVLKRGFSQILDYFTHNKNCFILGLKALPLRNRETSSSCGMLCSPHSQYLDSSGRFFKYSRQAWEGYNLLSSLYTTPQVFTSSSVNSMRGMGSPLETRQKGFKYRGKKCNEISKWFFQMQNLTVCMPWQDPQNTFAFSCKHCPWNPEEVKKLCRHAS